MRIWVDDDEDDPFLLLIIEEAGILQDTDPQRQWPEITPGFEVSLHVASAAAGAGAESSSPVEASTLLPLIILLNLLLV